MTAAAHAEEMSPHDAAEVSKLEAKIFSAIEQAAKLVYPADEASKLVDDLTQGDVSRERLKTTFEAIFDAKAEAIFEDTPGRYPMQSIPVLGIKAAADALAMRETAEIAKLLAPEAIRARIRAGNYGGKVVDHHVAKTEYTCGRCHGNCVLSCRSCNGGGTLHCNHCAWGKRMCYQCAGTGQIPVTNGSIPCAGCQYNFPRGKVTCEYCAGSTRVNCSGCGGHGEVTCGPCNGNGMFTRLHSVRTKIEGRLLHTGPLKDIEASTFKKWGAEGFKGQLAQNDKWLPWTDAPAVKVIHELSESGSRAIAKITAAASKVDMHFTFDGEKGYIGHIMIGEGTSYMSRFLAKRSGMAASTQWDDKSPSEYLKTLEPYPGLVSALAGSYEAGNGKVDFCERIRIESRGAIPPDDAESIGYRYDRCIETFKKQAVQKAAWGPISGVAIMAAALQSVGATQFVSVGAEIMAGAVAAGVGFVATGWLVRRSARAALRRETTAKSEIRLGKEGLLLPISAAILLGAMMYWRVDVWPFDRLDILRFYDALFI